MNTRHFWWGLVLLCLCLANLQAQTLVIPGNPTTGLRLVRPDNEGNLYIAGYFTGDLSLPPFLLHAQKGQYFLLKCLPDGKPAWVRQLSQPLRDMLWHEGRLFLLGQFKGMMRLDMDTLYARGDYNSFVAQFDTQGNQLWRQQFESSQDALACGLAAAPQGGVYVAGSFVRDIHIAGQTLQERMMKNLYLARFSATGALQWVRQATGGNTPLTGVFVWGITADPEGNPVIGGSVSGEGLFENMTLRSTHESFGAEGATFNHDIFLAKYDTLGNLRWVRNAGQHADVHDLTADHNGCVYLTGSFKGNQITARKQGNAQFDDTGLRANLNRQGEPVKTLFLAKYSPLGNLIWIRQPLSQDDSEGLALTFNMIDKCVYVVGVSQEGLRLSPEFALEISPTETRQHKIFALAYKPNGAIKWGQMSKSLHADEVADCKADALGNVYLCGRFKQEMVFGDVQLHADNPGSSGFVLRLSLPSDR